MKTATAATKGSTATSKLNKVLSGLGKLTSSCNDVRHCSRCNLPLKDSASWERGIGPICAKKDTRLFAKTIPANFAMATIYTLNVEAHMLPQTIQPVWTALTEVLLEKVERASRGTAMNQFLISGEDCSLVAKVIDFMLSFPIDPTPKRDLIQVVKHLGFVGLAGVLSGESSTGAAELKFENGKLFLIGSSNKAGFNAMRVIPGIVVPRRRGGGPYEAPAAQHEKFIGAVMEFWPCFDGKVDEITEQCKEWIVANPVKVAQQVSNPGMPEAKIAYRSATNEIVVSFQWIKEITPRIVEEIKTIPYKQRSYDPATKSWIIQADNRQRVVDLLSPHYSIMESENAMVTVPSIGAPRQGGYNRRPYYQGYRTFYR
jgi:hypothetical protein